MNIIEVKSAATEKAFLAINAELNKHNPNYIRPLDKEEGVFHGHITVIR